MKKITSFTLAAFVLTLLSSCYTRPSAGIVKVIVLDQNDFRVPGAQLHFYQDSPSIIMYNAMTDNNGEYLQQHTDEETGQALEVWLKVTATYGTSTSTANAHFIPGQTTVTEIHL